MLKRLILSIIFLFFVSSSICFAEEPKKEEAAEKKEPIKLEEKIVQTSHQINIDGKKINYTATTGTALIRNKKGEPEAEIFYIAYTKDGLKNPVDRPITFCFNGGPGSSSVWLHLGAFGPQKVDFNSKGLPEEPYRLVPNNESLLDITDLVFIDPVSTGYSRVASEKDEKKFHHVEEDIKSIGEFIRLYVTKNGRWTSPKFVAGESYGTTRAAGLADHLYDKYFLDLKGIILISAVLDFQAYYFQKGNDLPYITFLPTYTTIAWYHKKVSPDLQNNFEQTVKAAKEFAQTEYALALMKGDTLSEGEKRKVAAKLSRFTGLSEKDILKANLRIHWMLFSNKLLEDKNRIISRFDGMLTGVNEDPLSPKIQYDPSLSAFAPAFTATMNQYLHHDLNWVEDKEYTILADVFPWDFGKAKNQYLNMNQDLQDLMTQNNKFKIFVASGFYDMATPFSATDYTFCHLPIDPELKNNITMKNYAGGHMMYSYQPVHKQMKKDLVKFYKNSLPN